MKHIIICGERHVGKSTLVRRLLSEMECPVYGFMTKSMNNREDGFHDIYMMPADGSGTPVYLASCDTRNRNVDESVFETLGVQLLTNVKSDGIIVMDELGFMEANCTRFTSKVLELLDGDIPVLATVKSTHPNVEFLNRVRNHPNAERYDINESNRDKLWETLREKDLFKKTQS